MWMRRTPSGARGRRGKGRVLGVWLDQMFFWDFSSAIPAVFDNSSGAVLVTSEPALACPPSHAAKAVSVSLLSMQQSCLHYEILLSSAI